MQMRFTRTEGQAIPQTEIRNLVLKVPPLPPLLTEG